MGGFRSYQQKAEQHPDPFLCHDQFAIAAGKEDLQKKLNRQLLLNSRNSSARVSQRDKRVEVAQLSPKCSGVMSHTWVGGFAGLLLETMHSLSCIAHRGRYL